MSIFARINETADPAFERLVRGRNGPRALLRQLRNLEQAWQARCSEGAAADETSRRQWHALACAREELEQMIAESEHPT